MLLTTSKLITSKSLKKNKIESMNEWKLLREASQEVESWPNWLQNNAELLFEEEQEKQRKSEKTISRLP